MAGSDKSKQCKKWIGDHPVAEAVEDHSGDSQTDQSDAECKEVFMGV